MYAELRVEPFMVKGLRSDAETEGTLLGTPNREPQEYSRKIIECKDPGRYSPTVFLLYS